MTDNDSSLYIFAYADGKFEIEEGIITVAISEDSMSDFENATQSSSQHYSVVIMKMVNE